MKDFFSKCDQIRSFLRTANLVTFTEEILNRKLRFLWKEIKEINQKWRKTKIVDICFTANFSDFVAKVSFLEGKMGTRLFVQPIFPHIS